MAIDNLEFRNACRHGNGEVERDKGEETVCHLSENDDSRKAVMDEETGKITVDTRDVEMVIGDPNIAYGSDEGMHIKAGRIPVTIHNQRQADIRGGVRGEKFRDV